MLDFEFWVACPEEFSPKDSSGFANVNFTTSMKEAVEDTDLVTTDVWVSMGDENDTPKRNLAFKDYQVNESILKITKSDAIFLHCLPAIRGQEISENLFDDPKSRVFEQAENRLHAQKGLLIELIG